MRSKSWKSLHCSSAIRGMGVAILGAMIVGCGGGTDESPEKGAGGESAAAGSHDESPGASDGPADGPTGGPAGVRVDELIREGETHFKSLWQLTNGGENAEAYFSWDGSQLILQVTGRDGGCDQIYTMPSKGGEMTLVSTGKGRCTCAYFFPGNEKILFSSTHHHDEACPPTPDHSQGYVWPIYDTYDIFTANPDGTGLTALTNTPGYDAEATIGPDGTIVFTSTRDGDLEIYTMNADGTNVKRLTDAPGYDGGPFFSHDGSKIVYRASRPADAETLADYRRLLGQNLIRPGQLDIFVMNRDGSGKTRLTNNGAANFGPFFHPSNEKVIFASNLAAERGRNFDLFLVSVNGGEPERVTFEETFDGFPMFSPDGKYFVFASNRGAEKQGETNVFLAEWVE